DPTDRSLRKYQSEAIASLIRVYESAHTNHAMIVLATGLGKTYVAAETYRRICVDAPTRLLVLAHTNPLVYQLERAFWPFLRASQDTVVWNGLEKPLDDLGTASCVFACVDTVYEHIIRGNELPDFDMVLVDECHHVGGKMYAEVLGHLRAGLPDGPFLFGLTATPWRPDEVDLQTYFGEPLVTVDLVTGLKCGFLANVDYRMYTDNIDWEALSQLSGDRFSPRQINRTLFINQWDESVVHELRGVWAETAEPRAIVFCGTIEHAYWMCDRINAQGFCAADVVVSQARDGSSVPPYEKNRVLCDFADGIVQVVCAVDIFNEGVDVPDVNIVVFQRVTHSRRIFIQQLGRGLRLAEGKEKVVVLDFVSDIRRFAAGLELKSGLEGPVRVKLPARVVFRRVGGEDPRSESFLREWLGDVAAIEDAGEDAAVLAFPPRLDPAP
ncbi:MAG: DEAD/DEAH box helicase, partial [Coriobacteriia bacterium]|nr:DEAD/DEAH box helicase [Coriobacteriia bacterium]